VMISLVYRAVNAVARRVRSSVCEKGRELRLIHLVRRHCEFAMTEMSKHSMASVPPEYCDWPRCSSILSPPLCGRNYT
jgi:hypothetical protein